MDCVTLLIRFHVEVKDKGKIFKCVRGGQFDEKSKIEAFAGSL